MKYRKLTLVGLPPKTGLSKTGLITLMMVIHCLCSTHPILAQYTFAATYGNGAYNEGVTTLVMNDTTYLVVGNSSGQLQTSAPYFAIIDHQGMLIRDWMIASPRLKMVTAATMHDSIIWIIGYSHYQGKYDNMLIRMSTSGIVLTEVYWGQGGWNFPNALVVTHSDTAFIAGDYTDTLFGAKQGVLWCIDSSGFARWQRSYGGADEDAFLTLDTNQNNGLVMAGYTKSAGQHMDSALWVVATDRLGNLLWQTVEDYPGSDMVTGIRTDIAGGFILCGQSEYWVDYSKEAFIMRLDTLGVPQWKTRLGSEDEAAFFDIIQRPDSSYRMAGFYSGVFSLGKKEFYMQNCQHNGWWGPLLGGFIHGGKEDDIARSVTPAPDGGYLVTGTTRSFGPGISHIMVMKSDSAGTVLVNLGHQTSIRELQANNTSFSVFPNPVQDVLEIRFSGKTTDPYQDLLVFDISGRIVQQHRNIMIQNKVFKISVTDLEPGTYIVKSGLHHQKFIKQ